MKTGNDYHHSLSRLLLATIGNSRNLKIFRSILREKKFKRYKKESIEVAFSRLSKKGYVVNSSFGCLITDKGKAYVHKKHLLDYISSPFKENDPLNTIIAFDIPEKDRKIRNWLRNQIKIFNYKMLQKSLWLGPGPFPDSFLKHLEDLHIRKYVKIFKINKINN